jgi:hypothetical protein
MYDFLYMMMMMMQMMGRRVARTLVGTISMSAVIF